MSVWFRKHILAIYTVIQWLRCCVSTAWGLGLISGPGKIPHTMQWGQQTEGKKKKVLGVLNTKLG